MARTLTGYAFLGLIGFLGLRLLLGVIGFAVSILWSLLSLAAIGFVCYLILRIVRPDAARRVREWVAGQSTSES